MKIFFSSGHEEYHLAHSFFFASNCVYMVLFDCSLDVKDIIPKNKLTYWLHFLQTRLDNIPPVILVANKYDLLEKIITNENYKFSKEKMDKRLEEINLGI